MTSEKAVKAVQDTLGKAELTEAEGLAVIASLSQALGAAARAGLESYARADDIPSA
jgi:hypothetical protein